MAKDLKWSDRTRLVVTSAICLEDGHQERDVRSAKSHFIQLAGKNTSRTSGGDNLNYLVISRDFFLRLSSHSCNYGIFIFWCPYSPWATCIYSYTCRFPDSWTDFCNSRRTLESGWRRPESCIANSHASVPGRLLQKTRLKIILQYSSYVWIPRSFDYNCALRYTVYREFS
jgi:hypothetical protein